MNDVIAAILAGGRGERLRPITDYIPKPMLPIGDDEKPVLEYIIEWIKKFGIKDFVLLVGYKHKQIINYFRNGDRWGVNIRYSIDDDKYKGTGGALLKAYISGLFDGFDHILVWYGDIIAKVNIVDLVEKHKKNECDVTIVATKNYQLPVGVLEVLSNGDVVEVLEKPFLDKFVGIGIFLFNYSSIRYLKKMNKTNFDIGHHYLPFLLKNNVKIKIYEYSGMWIDVGLNFGKVYEILRYGKYFYRS